MFKKLIPALLMLLISAALVTSATFAWFSMNTEVTATGMQVKVKSNNTFLLIGEDTLTTADLIQAQTGADLTTEDLTVSDAESEVYPSSPVVTARLAAGSSASAAEIAQNKYFPSTDPVISNLATAAVESNWFTAQNGNPADSNDTVKNVNKLNGTANDPYEFSNYVIKRTVYLSLADGSNAAHNLTVTPTIALKETTPAQTATDITAVKVLVACGSNFVILDSSMSTAQSLHATADFTLTDTSAIQVDIYVYYDGEEDAVYTNNAADLADATVDLQFNVEVGTAA